MQTLTTVSNSTRGRLVSTTDIKRAGLLQKVTTIAKLIGRRPGHFEQVDGNKILVFAGQELYELDLV